MKNYRRTGDFASFNADNYRKVFAVGDIHGCFTLLEDKLKEVGFDKKTDLLVSVGDLVDRGPESHLAIEYAKKPWFTYVRGNHEDMTRSGVAGTYHHTINGGDWYNKLESDELKRKTSRVLNEAPVFLQVERNGKQYGFVHADFPTNEWSDIHTRNSESFVLRCIWDRDRIYRAQHDELYQTRFGQKDENNHHKPIRGIDHVFFGHTPIDEPLTRDNCTWLDTGAVFAWRAAQKLSPEAVPNKLSVVELDNY